MFDPSSQLRQLVREPTSGSLVLARNLPWPKPGQYSEPKKAKSRFCLSPAVLPGSHWFSSSSFHIIGIIGHIMCPSLGVPVALRRHVTAFSQR
jgi:hypothetical protein